MCDSLGLVATSRLVARVLFSLTLYRTSFRAAVQTRIYVNHNESGNFESNFRSRVMIEAFSRCDASRGCGGDFVEGGGGNVKGGPGCAIAEGNPGFCGIRCVPFTFFFRGGEDIDL
jgi:hypothetical protein